MGGVSRREVAKEFNMSPHHCHWRASVVFSFCFCRCIFYWLRFQRLQKKALTHTNTHTHTHTPAITTVGGVWVTLTIPHPHPYTHTHTHTHTHTREVYFLFMVRGSLSFQIAFGLLAFEEIIIEESQACSLHRRLCFVKRQRDTFE